MFPERNRQALSHVGTIRLTNETFDDWTFTYDGTASGSEVGYSQSPLIEWKALPSLTVSGGARFITSLSDRSRYYPIRNTSYAYGRIFWYF